MVIITVPGRTYWRTDFSARQVQPHLIHSGPGGARLGKALVARRPQRCGRPPLGLQCGVGLGHVGRRAVGRRACALSPLGGNHAGSHQSAIAVALGFREPGLSPGAGETGRPLGDHRLSEAGAVVDLSHSRLKSRGVGFGLGQPRP
jgi:hypothetical protein